MKFQKTTTIVVVTILTLMLIKSPTAQSPSQTLLLQVVLQTDKFVYLPDQVVTLSGNLTDSLGSAVSGGSVALEVHDSHSNIIFLDVAISNVGGCYCDTFRLDIASPFGVYNVYAVASKTGYGSASRQTTFMVGSAPVLTSGGGRMAYMN